MGNLTFIERDGTRREVIYKDGASVMHTATQAGIDGIIGECGGSCTCATCHVYLAEDDFARLKPPDAMEQDMLEFAALNVRPTSRLGCQIHLDETTDGLVVEVAKA